jgi:hypothetical protein
MTRGNVSISFLSSRRTKWTTQAKAKNNMENKQTAVEWLYEKMLKDDVSFYDYVTAMNMHRDEIINAFNEGHVKAPMINGEKFYDQTYGEKENCHPMDY